MKNVFSNSEVPHIWANKQQASARNSSHSIFFEGDTIYSYGRHFAIAKHAIHAQTGKEIVLFVNRSYSNSTAKHINYTRQACQQFDRIYCHDPEASPAINFEAFRKQAINIASSLPNSRKPEIYLNQIHAVAEQAKAYANAIGDTIPDSLSEALSITSKEQYIQLNEKAIARKKAEEKKEQARLKRLHTEQKKKFLAGEIFRIGVGGHKLDYIRLDKGSILTGEREDLIHTSQGINIKLAIAKRFFTHLQAVLKKGGCEECKQSILPYNVAYIKQDEVKIGCHTISMENIMDVAKDAGWIE